MNIILRISFFTLSNIEINFVICHIHCKTYTTTKALPTTRQFELIQKKKYVAIAFNLENEVFVVYIASIS